ncbi:translation initiation factor IF-3 [Candidatus Vidania fulgoroideorum]
MFIKIIDEKGKYLGLLNFKEAIKKAKKKNLDLIKINDKVKPNIFKLGDYKKHIYNIKKKKKKVNKIKNKEIRLKYNISDNDFFIKKKSILKFIKKKYKVKINIKTINNSDKIEKKINKFFKKKKILFFTKKNKNTIIIETC